MSKQFRIFVILFMTVSNVFVYGQYRNALWLSFGVNIVDDSGKQFSNPLDIRNNWNFSMPLLASFGYDMTNEVGVVIQASYNEYVEGKLINSVVLDKKERYMSIDLLGRYYFQNDIYFPWDIHYRWKMYITSGVCACIREQVVNFNFVIGGGVNYRINDLIRIELEMLPKIRLISNIDGNFNHFQYGLKLSYLL